MKCRWLLLGLIACAQPAPTKPVPPPPQPVVVPPAAAAAPSASASVEDPLASPPAEEPAATAPAPPTPPTVGADDAPGKRTRFDTAVILFGTADLTGKKRLRFVPAICVIKGKLETGKPCGLAMPAKATLRTTHAATGGASVISASRATADYKDDAGGQVYKAPAGPACCMYNTCREETLPYYAAQADANPAKAVLAVWPETADVELTPQPHSLQGMPADGPWSKDATFEQVVTAGQLRLVTGRGSRCGSCGAIWAKDGAWATNTSKRMGAKSYDVLATSDLDHDGHPEAIIYVGWANDYGLEVRGNDWSKVLYDFSCGNI